MTKRKVIGTIENIRLPALPGLARVCVRSRTHIGLVAERQVNIRPAFKDSKLLPFGLYFPFLSPSLIPLSHPLSIPRPPTPAGYQPIYIRGVDQLLPSAAARPRCSSSPVLVEYLCPDLRLNSRGNCDLPLGPHQTKSDLTTLFSDRFHRHRPPTLIFSS